MSINKIRTRSLVSRHHFGQKYGELDYFNYHLCGVAESLERCGYSEKHILTGYAHDVLEDTECREDEIVDVGGYDVLDAVIVLTKDYYGAETRKEYLKRVSKNEIARDVKMHDMSFNMLNCFKEGQFGKMSYYLGNMQTLQNLIKEETN